MAQAVQRRGALGLAWRIVAVWFLLLILLIIFASLLGPFGSVEIALLFVLAIAGGLAWWRWL